MAKTFGVESGVERCAEVFRRTLWKGGREGAGSSTLTMTTEAKKRSSFTLYQGSSRALDVVKWNSL